MPRQPRDIAEGAPYHILNRSNGRFAMFETQGCYRRFCQILALASAKHSMPISAFCIMPNHWHLVVYPAKAAHLSQFVAWLCNVHTRRYHVAHDTVGQGPLYQGRYRAVLLKDDLQHFIGVRYVERNALSAGLVRSCADWPWSSVSPVGRSLVPLQHAPFQLAKDWIAQVDRPMTALEADATSIQ